MGRAVTFVARLLADGNVSLANGARAICCNERTALLVDNHGQGTVLTQNPSTPQYAYFLKTSEMPAVCKPKEALVISQVEVWRGGAGGSFDLNDWSGITSSQVQMYYLSASKGKLSSSKGGIY